MKKHFYYWSFLVLIIFINSHNNIKESKQSSIQISFVKDTLYTGKNKKIKPHFFICNNSNEDIVLFFFNDRFSILDEFAVDLGGFLKSGMYSFFYPTDTTQSHSIELVDFENFVKNKKQKYMILKKHSKVRKKIKLYIPEWKEKGEYYFFLIYGQRKYYLDKYDDETKQKLAEKGCIPFYGKIFSDTLHIIVE